jgi:REP element-mobilizing transposase RayT
VPRTTRIDVAGAIQHVTVRGNRRQAIYLDDRDRTVFLREFASAAARFRWTCLSYCLMSNHCHLVVETHDATLGVGMHRLDGRYAQQFNRRHEIDGRLFQGRYGSTLVSSDTYLAQLLRYVALNPVAAGLCSSPSDWPWSGHRQLLGAGPESRVEQLLESWGGRAGERYARLFDPACPLAAEFGAESPWTHRPPLEALLSAQSLEEGMRAARDEGYRLAEIAAATGVSVSTVWRRTREK